MRRAIVYVRVSSKGQVDGDSRAIQERDSRIYCGAHDFEVVGVLEDVYTGYESYEQRDGLQEAIRRVRSGEANTLVAWRVDRAGREVIDNLMLLREVSSASGYLDIVGVGNIPNNAMGRALLSTLSMAGDIEREAIILRTGSARRTRAERGEILAAGTPQYGYSFSGKRKEAYVVDPNTAPIVQQMFAWAEMGMATREIARRLNARGILTPSAYRASRGENGKRIASPAWVPKSVLNILKWRGYTGEHSAYRRENYKVTVIDENGRPKDKVRKRKREADDETVLSISIPALVSREQFERVQAQLAQHRQNTVREEEDETMPLLGRGIAVCGMCGGRMVVSRNGSNRKRQYVCTNRMHVIADPAKICPGGFFALTAEDVDADVWAKAKEIARDDARFQRLLDNKRERLREVTAEVFRMHDAVMAEYAEQQKLKEKWLRLIAATDDEDVIATYQQELKQTIETLKGLEVKVRQINERGQHLEGTEKLNEEVRSILREMLAQAKAEREGTSQPDPFDRLTRTDKRRILMALDVRVLCYPRDSEHARTHAKRWDFTFSNNGNAVSNGTHR